MVSGDWNLESGQPNSELSWELSWCFSDVKEELWTVMWETSTHTQVLFRSRNRTQCSSGSGFYNSTKNLNQAEGWIPDELSWAIIIRHVGASSTQWSWIRTGNLSPKLPLHPAAALALQSDLFCSGATLGCHLQNCLCSVVSTPWSVHSALITVLFRGA